MSALYPPEFQGGATLVCRRLARELGARGHSCSIFSGRTTREEPLGAVARGRVDESTTFRVNVGGALAPWERDGYSNPVATEAFRRFLDEQRPDVVHVHSLQGLGVGLLHASRAAGRPVVVTMHDWWWLCPCLFRLSPTGTICPARVRPERCSGVSGLDFPARRATLDAALTAASRILVPSGFLRASLIENGFDASTLVVDENGVAPPAVAPRRQPGEGDGPTRLVYVGGAGNRAKGLEVLLEALAGVSLEVDLVLDAYAVSAEEVAPVAESLGDRLRCHDRFPSACIDEVMGAADVVAVPSLMRESFSLVTHEALARGRPVLASDCGAPELVVRDGENGFVLPAGDVGAWTEALERIAGDRALLRRLGRTRPLPVRTPAEHAAGAEALYRAVLRETERPRPPAARRRIAGRRVLFLTGMDGAPLRYRVWNVVERLRRAGIEGDVLYHSDVRALRAARAADVVVLYRAPLGSTVARVVRQARSAGVPVVFSSDDLVFREKDLDDAPALEHRDPEVVEGYRQSVVGHARCLAAADAFLGSTPELVAAAAEGGRPSHLIPNGLSAQLAELSRRARLAAHREARNGEVRLGFASGTDTHDADLDLVAPAIADTLERFPEARLDLWGPVRLPRALDRVAARVRRRPFVAWNELPERLAALDVNLAPLDTNRAFNRGKSEVKWIEAAAVGVPTIASAAPAFVRASREGRTALLCRSESDWRDGLARLVDDAALRSSLAEAARRDVETTYSADAQVDDVVDVVVDLLDCAGWNSSDPPEPVMLEAGEGSHVAVEPGDAVFDRYQLDAEAGGALGPGGDVEQRFTCLRDGLTRVDVRVGTYARRNDLDVHLALHDEQGTRLARATVDASRMVDRLFVSVELPEPLRESAGREITIRATAPEACEGNEILLWHAPSDLGGLTIGGVEQPGRALSFRAFSARPAEVA